MVCVVFGVGVLPQLTPVSGRNMAEVVALTVLLLVPVEVLPPVPTVGVPEGLAVPVPVGVGDGDGVAVGVSLGDGVGVGSGVPVGVGVLLGVGVRVQAIAGIAKPAFLRDVPGGGLEKTPSGGCHGAGLARPVAAAARCWWPGEVTELVGWITASCIRFSVTMPTTTTATTAATANAGLNQAAAGPRRPARLPAGVGLMRCAPAAGCRMARWLSAQRKDSSRTLSRIRLSRSHSAAPASVERADRGECDRRRIRSRPSLAGSTDAAAARSAPRRRSS